LDDNMEATYLAR